MDYEVGYYWVLFQQSKAPTIGHYDGGSLAGGSCDYPWSIMFSDDIYENKDITVLQKVEPYHDKANQSSH